jgi:endo-1,4-beta-xylanase
MMKLQPGRACGFALLLCVSQLCASAQMPQQWPLWTGGAPGSTSTLPEKIRVTPQGEHVVTHVSDPSITPFLPAAGEANGVAVIIAPGGGHSEIWIDHEGYNVARWLQAHGVAAFVLKYRLAREAGSTYTVEGTELGDMQRAIRLVKSRAAQNGIDPAHVGVMGFSAGGELAALASTHADEGTANTADVVDRLSARPAFEALIYPAIPKDMVITSRTPPAFLACGELDRPDISRGLPALYLKLRDAGVSTELHIFAGMGHGFGIRATNPAGIATWPALFLDWLSAEGFLPKSGANKLQ